MGFWSDGDGERGYKPVRGEHCLAEVQNWYCSVQARNENTFSAWHALGIGIVGSAVQFEAVNQGSSITLRYDTRFVKAIRTTSESLVWRSGIGWKGRACQALAVGRLTNEFSHLFFLTQSGQQENDITSALVYLPKVVILISKFPVYFICEGSVIRPI